MGDLYQIKSQTNQSLENLTEEEFKTDYTPYENIPKETGLSLKDLELVCGTYPLPFRKFRLKDQAIEKPCLERSMLGYLHFFSLEDFAEKFEVQTDLAFLQKNPLFKAVKEEGIAFNIALLNFKYFFEDFKAEVEEKYTEEDEIIKVWLDHHYLSLEAFGEKPFVSYQTVIKAIDAVLESLELTAQQPKKGLNARPFEEQFQKEGQLYQLFQEEEEDLEENKEAPLLDTETGEELPLEDFLEKEKKESFNNRRLYPTTADSPLLSREEEQALFKNFEKNNSFYYTSLLKAGYVQDILKKTYDESERNDSSLAWQKVFYFDKNHSAGSFNWKRSFKRLFSPDYNLPDYQGEEGRKKYNQDLKQWKKNLKLKLNRLNINWWEKQGKLFLKKTKELEKSFKEKESYVRSGSLEEKTNGSGFETKGGASRYEKLQEEISRYENLLGIKQQEAGAVYKALKKAVKEREREKDLLVKSNVGMVVNIAKNFVNQGLSFNDLIEEGEIGIMKALYGFDYKRGYKFTTYANWWIKQSIRREIANKGRTIRIPVHMREAMYKVSLANRALVQDLGREPKPEELAERCGMPLEKIQKILDIAKEPISLETPVGEEGSSHLWDFIEDPNPLQVEREASKNDLTEIVEEVLNELSPKEAEVLRYRNGIGLEKDYTLEEVGKIFHVTRERIRQIESGALDKLRRPHYAQRLAPFFYGNEDSPKRTPLRNLINQIKPSQENTPTDHGALYFVKVENKPIYLSTPSIKRAFTKKFPSKNPEKIINYQRNNRQPLPGDHLFLTIRKGSIDPILGKKAFINLEAINDILPGYVPPINELIQGFELKEIKPGSLDKKELASQLEAILEEKKKK